MKKNPPPKPPFLDTIDECDVWLQLGSKQTSTKEIEKHHDWNTIQNTRLDFEIKTYSRTIAFE